MINILPEVKPASSKYEHPEDKKSKHGRHKQNDLTKAKTTNKGSKALQAKRPKDTKPKLKARNTHEPFHRSNL